MSSEKVFVDALIRQGKVLATQRQLMVALLDFASAQRGTVEFGERRISFADSSRDFLSRQPTIGAADRLNALAEEKANSTGLSYSEAFSAVQAEYPSLVHEYIAHRFHF